MNNLKKVLALVVAIAMFASMSVLVSAQDFTDEADFGSSADAINLLSDLGLINGYEDGSFKPANTITRAEVAAIMVRMLGLEDQVVKGETEFTDVPADNWASGYINVAQTQGIIDGMGDGTFAPSAEVTYEQVVKMVMCALGYEPAAVKNGGYPAGYLKMASTSKTGVTKGVSGTVGQAASRATVAKIVYNALEIDLMDQETYTTGINGDDYAVKKGHTVLSDYLELEKIDGVVVNTYLASVNYDKDEDKTVEIVVTKNYEEDAVKDSDADYVKNDKYSFVAEGTDAAALLGYTVTAYVGANDDDDDAIFAITAKANKNVMTAVATEDGFDTKKDGAFVTEDGQLYVNYFKSSNSRSATEAKIINTIKGYVGNDDELIEIDNIVINGFLQSQTEDAYKEIELADSLLNEVDEVRFLDNNNDGDFEYVFVTKFDKVNGKEFQVEEVDVEDLYITGTDGESLDLDDEDKLIEIVKDGQVVGIDAIAADDIVTVLVDPENVNVLTVYVSSAKVEGSVEQVDDDEYTIANKEYTASTNTDDVLTFDAGDEGVFFLNFEGKIAAQETTSTIKGADYVYIIDMDMDEGTFGDNSLLIKAVTAKGTVETLTVKSKKVDMYNYPTADKPATDENVTDEFIFENLKLDEKGNLAKIKTNAAGEITEFYFPGAEDFDSFANYANDKDANKPKEYSEAKNKYGNLTLPTSAIVFNIDSTEEDLEDAVTVSTVGGVFEDGSSYSFIAYGEDRDSVDCVVTTDADVSFDPTAAVMVVTKTATTSYDDEKTTKITGIMNGETVSVVVDTDESDCVELADTLQKGNVIMFSGSSVVKNVTVILNATEDGIKGAAPSVGELKNIVVAKDVSEDDAEKYASLYFDQVVEKKSGYFKLGDLPYDEENDNTPDFVATDNCRYTLVNYTANKVNITAGDSGDLKKSNEKNPVYALIKTAEDSVDDVTDIVIFRGMENLD